MLERADPAVAADAHLQSFALAYDYPVYFTRDALDPANLCLVKSVVRLEPNKRHRVAVFIDEGLMLADPKLNARLGRYAAHHEAAIEMMGEAVIVPGGEAVKNQHSNVEHVLRELAARRIDRQSFALAIGGGAMLDAVGLRRRHLPPRRAPRAHADHGAGAE